MNPQYLIDAFNSEAQNLNELVRNHPKLSPFFNGFNYGDSSEVLKNNYLSLLKMKHDYVKYTVPMLNSSGSCFKSLIDDYDSLNDKGKEYAFWAESFSSYASDETDTDYGHHIWALNDMKVLNAGDDLFLKEESETSKYYGKFFVEKGWDHPFAILGAKGVLEHLSILMSDDLVAGVIEKLEPDFPNIKNAVSFFSHHGKLDLDHVKDGDKKLERLANIVDMDPVNNNYIYEEVLLGIYVTSGTYRKLLNELL